MFVLFFVTLFLCGGFFLSFHSVEIDKLAQMEETDSWRDRLKLSSEDLTDPINLEGQSVKHDLELLTAPHFCHSRKIMVETSWVKIPFIVFVVLVHKYI